MDASVHSMGLWDVVLWSTVDWLQWSRQLVSVTYFDFFFFMSEQNIQTLNREILSNKNEIENLSKLLENDPQIQLEKNNIKLE